MEGGQAPQDREHEKEVRRTSYERQSHIRVRIDNGLLAETMQVTGASSTHEVIAQSEQLLLRLKRQEQLRGARGRLRSSSDLAVMRRD